MTRKTLTTPRREGARRTSLRLPAWRHQLAQAGGRCVMAVRARPLPFALALVLVAGSVAMGLAGGADSAPSAHTRVTELQLPERDTDEADSQAPVPPAAGNPASPGAVSRGLSDTTGWTEIEVRPGQTLEQIFRELGLTPGELHRAVHIDDNTRKLARIRPGQQFAFDIDDDGLRALRTEHDEEHWLLVERGDEGLTSRLEPRLLDRRIVEASGTINTSLYRDAREAGLSDDMVMRLAGIFGWDIDFALDLRVGDRFALIYEEIWRDGEYLRDGPILAARFANRGEVFDAVRFDAGDGPDFFAPDGRPMRKAFLRAPLNFTRVTSNFNPRRYHPVTRRVRAHNGTDYGANTGTPVWASGDGTVIESTYNATNGHYVFIKHGNNTVTRYLHLSQRAVSRGDRVRQGQTIGRVGATGLATGPHLHYEFLVHGAHRNPRTVDLPEADPLPDDQLDAFRQARRPLLARLEAVDDPRVLLASSGASDCEQAAQAC